jgi:hypothetical protein
MGKYITPVINVLVLLPEGSNPKSGRCSIAKFTLINISANSEQTGRCLKHMASKDGEKEIGK